MSNSQSDYVHIVTIVLIANFNVMWKWTRNNKSHGYLTFYYKWVGHKLKKSRKSTSGCYMLVYTLYIKPWHLINNKTMSAKIKLHMDVLVYFKLNVN